MFNNALENEFDLDLVKERNISVFENIVGSDILNQIPDFQVIWNSIKQRIDNCTNKEKLLSAVLESDINLLVNHVDGTNSDRKFCIDYFIDINDKRKELDNLDIIRHLLSKKILKDD